MCSLATEYKCGVAALRAILCVTVCVRRQLRCIWCLSTPLLLQLGLALPAVPCGAARLLQGLDSAQLQDSTVKLCKQASQH